PLHRHALLLEQLPLQGAALQLVRVHGAGDQRAARAQPRRHGARARRHGEMHLLRAAHPARGDAGARRGARPLAERGRHRVPAGLPDERHPVRVAGARRHRHGRVAQGGARVRRPARARHPAAHAVPREDRQPEPGARGLMPALAEPLIIGQRSDAELSDELLGTATRRWSKAWRVPFALSFAGTLWLFFCVSLTVVRGIGVWGNNIPVAWAFGIINFVWWIGIGHAGTFISAILHIFEQKWRASINRFAEAMTLFAVLQAALFPLLHLGRPWFGYWLFPYPSTMDIWPQVKSALPWDAAAITTYFSVSLLFWYLGLLPDLAGLRDTAPERWRRRVDGLSGLGWLGSERAYSHYRSAYLLLAGIATPLVLSVHSVVSSDFAMALVPGWHSTIYPPYFVAGAIFSGFA